ncbi:anti-sigma-V factor RsiV [Heyndrickxia sporothermodurans]|nr:anti-sigma-V factor RsiV [Heyndrickxia sporothermodurans]
MDKKLEALKKEYASVQIPKELDELVEKALQPKQKKKRLYVWPASVAAAAVLFTALVNFSPDAARAMSKIPVVKEIVKVITFKEYKEERNTSSIDLKTPAISGLENKTLEKNINGKYVDESRKLFKEYKKSVSSKKGHFSIYSDYDVVTETPVILSVRRDIERTQASGYIQKQFVTIDKQNQVVLTLKGLFKDDRYIQVISENIKEQMKQQMKADSNKIYWVTSEDLEPFKQIKPNQQFYINKHNQLVISFDEYEVAPGYMGAVEFTIPTKIISSLLVGDRYIY